MLRLIYRMDGMDGIWFSMFFFFLPSFLTLNSLAFLTVARPYNSWYYVYVCVCFRMHTVIDWAGAACISAGHKQNKSWFGLLVDNKGFQFPCEQPSKPATSESAWSDLQKCLLQNGLLNGLIPHWILWFACYIPSSPVSVTYTFVYEISVHLDWRQQECTLSCRAPNPQQSALGGIWEKTQKRFPKMSLNRRPPWQQVARLKKCSFCHV